MLQAHSRKFQQEILRQLTPRQIRSIVQPPGSKPSGRKASESRRNSDENARLLPLVPINRVLYCLYKLLFAKFLRKKKKKKGFFFFSDGARTEEV
jgi:hypothetical protein